ncbi:hypothetical protein ACFVXQ_27310 [Kitasatospora sp. NPDC058263]
MNAASLHGHHDDRQPIACAQDVVAEALPSAQRMEFHREMGGAGVETIGGVLKRWWLRAELYRNPEGDRSHAAARASTAPGHLGVCGPASLRCPVSDFIDVPDENATRSLSPAVEEFLEDPGTPVGVFSAVVAFLQSPTLAPVAPA